MPGGTDENEKKKGQNNRHPRQDLNQQPSTKVRYTLYCDAR